MADHVLTPEQVAERLQLKPDTMRGWLRTGKLRAAKFGRVWRICKEDLQAFIEYYLPAQPVEEHIGGHTL
jgi:excisionase family DNA binding protein